MQRVLPLAKKICHGNTEVQKRNNIDFRVSALLWQTKSAVKH